MADELKYGDRVLAKSSVGDVVVGDEGVVESRNPKGMILVRFDRVGLVKIRRMRLEKIGETDTQPPKPQSTPRVIGIHTGAIAPLVASVGTGKSRS